MNTSPIAGLVAGLVILMQAGSQCACAQCNAVETSQLAPTDALQAEDHYGCAVAIWEEIIVVGADQNGLEQQGPGAAHVFRFLYRYDASTWDCEGSLNAGQAIGDEFGRDVAVWDDSILVGAPGRSAAHVFRYDDGSWGTEADLSLGGGSDRLGHAVAIEGNVAVVGAPHSDAQGSHSGAAYVFRYDGSTWKNEAQLLAFDGAEYEDDLFGSSVAIYGDRIIVGAPMLEGEDGSAYVYLHDGSAWTNEARLPVLSAGRFGSSVAIGDGVAVVGAPEAGGTGAASVFRNEGEEWFEDDQLFASDAAADDEFGCAVGLSGEFIVVGAKGNDGGGDGAGAGYIFQHDGEGWAEQAKLLASNAGSGDTFGSAIAVQNQNAVVGAPLNDDQASDGGCAYVFGGLSDCQPNGNLDLCDIMEGESTDENSTGMPDECEPVLATENAKLVPEEVAESDLFGCSVAIDGEYLVGGAMYDYPHGAAYVYHRAGTGADNWNEDETITDPEPEGVELFGHSVSVSGEAAVVGAPYGGPGRAMIFRRDSPWWPHEADLVVSNPDPGERFGFAVAMSGDVAIVGAPWDDEIEENDAGSASIFRRDGSDWPEEFHITITEGSAEDHFGYDVAISGDVAVVGMPGDDTYGTASGAAYVYRYNGEEWVEEEMLSPGEPAWNEQFGTAVAVSGDVIAIGAPGDDEGRPWGTVQVFRYDADESGWVPEATLAPGDGQDGDGFGYSVSVSGSTILAGADGDDDLASRSGAAYAFFYDGAEWNEEAKLRASDGEADNVFGGAVSISGDLAVIGSAGDNDHGDESGSAYVVGGMSDCDENGHIDIFDIGIGWSLDENGNGIPDQCECPADFDGDGDVDTADLLVLLAAWGTPDGDIDGDGDTDTADLLALLAAWGDCP